MNKSWQVKNTNLIRLHAEACRLLTTFLSHRISHVYRSAAGCSRVVCGASKC